MAAEYYESKPVIVARDEIPADALKPNRNRSMIYRLDKVLPMIAKFYDPNWRKAPLIPHNLSKEELANSQFTYGYANKVWWDATKKELWATFLGTKEAVAKAESGEWSTGFSIDFDYLIRENADGTLALIPYLLHIAPCGADQPALSGMSSPGELYQLATDKVLPSPVTGMALSFAQVTTISPTILKGKENQMANETTTEGNDGAGAGEGNDTKDTTAKGTSAFINYKEIKRAHSAINAAIGNAEAMAKAQAEFDDLLAAARAELEALSGGGDTGMCNKSSIETDGNADNNGMALNKDVQKQVDDLVRQNIGLQLSMIGATDADKKSFLDALPKEGLSLTLIQPMIDILQTNLIKNKLPNENRFALNNGAGTGLNNTTFPKKMPEKLEELEQMGVQGYALCLKSQPGFEEAEFNPEYEFGIKRDELAAKGK